MVRRIVLLGGLFVALVLFTMGTAVADRLGGAYRGPYEDEIKPKEDSSTVVAAETTPNAADKAADAGTGGEQGGGDMGTGGGEGGGETTPPPEDGGGGSGDPGAGMDDGGSSGSSGPTGPPPGASSGSGGISGGSGLGGGPGGKAAVIDTKAYWPFYFEYNKEAIIERVLTERGAAGKLAPICSSWFFTSASEIRQITPVTDDQKTDVIFPVLKQALEHKSPWVRDAACLALGKLGTAEAVPLLVERSHRETDLEVRQDAILALGLTRQVEALDPLLKALTQSDPRIRPYAALALALLGRKEEAMGDVLKQYRVLCKSRDDQETAAVYAVALGHLIGDEQVDQLAAPLREKGRDLLKSYVCQALGNVGTENARRWLIRSSKKERGPVRAAVALALAKFPDRDTIGLLTGHDFAGNSDRMTKVFSQVSLGGAGRTIPQRDKVRRQIRAVLQQSAEKPLKNPYAAMFATIALGIMNDDGANSFFHAELGEDKLSRFSSENYSAMAMALALMRDHEAARYLRGIVRRGKDPNLRGYAALALGILGDLDAKDLLVNIIDDPRERYEIQRPACLGLGLIGDRKDLKVLLKALKFDRDEKWTVRGAAAMAIGLIGDQAALKPLITMATEDPDNANRAFAIVALGYMVDPEVMPRLPQLFQHIQYREEVGICRDALRNL